MNARRLRPGFFVLALALSVRGVIAAPVNDFKLEFVPQQAVAGTPVAVSAALREQAFQLRIVDQRGAPDPSAIGSRTNDADKVFPLRATNDLSGFVSATAASVLKTAGLEIRPDAREVLEIGLVSFDVRETNQAVGATFNSVVRLGLRRVDAAGKTLWHTSATGDTSRYGRKFSNANCNEVLSDALLEALANAFGDLSSAESAHDSEPPSAAAATASLSPAELLEEVRALLARGFQTDTVLEFVRGKVLNRPFQSADLLAWKEREVPEEILRVALACRVR